jgi:hypothetical protein
LGFCRSIGRSPAGTHAEVELRLSPHVPGHLGFRMPAPVVAERCSISTKGILGRILGHVSKNLFRCAGRQCSILLARWWLIPLGQTLANAAKWSYLARPDVELVLFDWAPCF